ncbi:MAG: NAD(P)H-dependent oxidoreductase subunit E [Deltaproteobacteria bacterium]|nr:NAD(P)H-dependent oxidoreductase subunit E [Deltaproteobacteria bacterium]
MSHVNSGTKKEIIPEMWEKMDKIIDKYKDKPGSLIPVLEECQNVCGYLPMEVQKKISKGLNIPGSAVYGVVSFYSFFTMVPKGRHTIKVCLGTACYVRGGNANLDYIKDAFKVEVGSTTTDFRFSLDSVRCLGACGMAPAMVVDDDTYAQVGKKNIMEILESYK